jgi:hypothetical protein
VCQSTGILVFVPVLAATSGPRVPLNLEVSIVEHDLTYFLGINHRDGNRRGVNSSFSFGGWDALEAVTT